MRAESPRSWTRAEYERLIELGLFRPGDSVELLGGQLIVSEPQGRAHYTAVLLVEEALRAALGPGWLVRTQGPIALDDQSEPEPDVTAVPGRARDYSRAHPVQPALVVEVAETSLTHDREHKGSLLEVYRGPIPDPSAPFGWRYASKVVLGPQSSVAPLAAASASIVVSDLLP